MAAAPSEAELLFKKLLKELQPMMKQFGFRRSSQNFILESEECWAVINFQKSRWSNPGEKTFYINIAVAAKRELPFRGMPTDKPPAYYACRWYTRAESVGPEPRIAQWTLKDEHSYQETLIYLRTLLEQYAIPTLKNLMSEESLLLEWKNDHSDYRTLKAKSILLAANNREAELRETIGNLIEKCGGGVASAGVKEHLEQLQKSFPEIMNAL